MSTKWNHPSLARYGAELRTFFSETWLGYALVVPATLLVTVTIVYPTIRGIYLALFESHLLYGNEIFVGLENFMEMASDPTFWFAIRNSVVLTGVAVALQYVLGLGLALTLKERLPGMGVFRSLSMVTWVIPIIVMVIIFRFLVQPGFGLVNILLAQFELPTNYWFGDPAVAFPLIVVMHVWRNVPFYAIALMAAMRSIPESQYEAAKLDGAGPLQRFRHITLPQIRYVSMVMIVLHVIFTFNNFDIVFLATGGGPLGTTEVLATYVYDTAFATYALGYAASMGVVMLVLLLIFTVIYVRLETR